MNDMTSVPLASASATRPPQPPPLPPTPVTFIGRPRRVRPPRDARGAALELVTAGFYRFWLATDIRRHLWSNTLIDGDAAEYTGRGKELLIGFLFALAILVPIYLVYFLDRHRSRALQGVRQLSADPRLLRLRAIRDLSRAALPADAHGLARRALLDGRLGLGLCLAGGALGIFGGVDARPRPAVAGGGARALQDAALLLRRSAGQISTAEPWEFFKRAWGSVAADAVCARFCFRCFLSSMPHFKAIEWRWWLSGIRFGDVRWNRRCRAMPGHGALLEGDRLVLCWRPSHSASDPSVALVVGA